VSRRGPIIAVVVGLALSALIVAGLILPKASQVRVKQKDVVTAKQQEQALRVHLQELQADAKTAPADRKLLAKLNRQVPPTADLPGIIRSINTVADQSGVSFMIIAPGQPNLSNTGQVSTIPTNITVVGHFFAVDQFLYKLEGLQRASKVISVQISAGPKATQEGGQIAVLINAEFYTTDVSAGPGSIPGSTQAVGPGTGSTGATPRPSASPSPSSTGSKP